MLVEPETILGRRPGRKKNLRGIDVLIQWKGLPPLETTWEPLELISQKFPSFHLEDKVNLAGRGNDRAPILLTYRKRTKSGDICKGEEGISSERKDHVGPM
ncbi:Ribonuclease H-like domain containing protein [Abeliophyllum distichum]|uniref:Ribonuclease H-like domain containing protein n=1 Tax=Abeliophyllum distichum TaxID=126358 RepID=A0ABD1PCA5_9LAMI